MRQFNCKKLEQTLSGTPVIVRNFQTGCKRDRQLSTLLGRSEENINTVLLSDQESH